MDGTAAVLMFHVKHHACSNRRDAGWLARMTRGGVHVAARVPCLRQLGDGKEHGLLRVRCSWLLLYRRASAFSSTFHVKRPRSGRDALRGSCPAVVSAVYEIAMCRRST